MIPAGRSDGGRKEIARKDGRAGSGRGGGEGRRRSTQRDKIICVELSPPARPDEIVDAGDDEVTSAAWEERKWLENFLMRPRLANAKQY